MSTPGGSGRQGPRARTIRGSAPGDGYPPDEFDVDYQPGQRRGAHRAATSAFVRRLPLLVLALVTAVAVVGAVLLLTGAGDGRGSLATALTGGSGADPAPTTDAAATTPATSATSATSATEPPPASTEPSATSEPAATADRSVELVVLNGTVVSGLAAGVGQELVALGWSVGTVGNVPQKPVDATVVLWSDEEDEVTAEAVAADLDAAVERSGSADGGVVVVVGTDRS